MGEKNEWNYENVYFFAKILRRSPCVNGPHPPASKSKHSLFIHSFIHSIVCFSQKKNKIVKWARECFFPSVSNLLRNLLRIVLFVCVFVCFLFCVWMCSCFCVSNQMMIFIFIWAHPTFSCWLFYGHSFLFSYSFFSFFCLNLVSFILWVCVVASVKAAQQSYIERR